MNTFQKMLLAALMTARAGNGANAGETKTPKAVGVAVPPEASNSSVSSVSNVAGGKGGGAAASSYARQGESAQGTCMPLTEPAPEAAKNTGPGRISTNVTVPKQTQGATFGEKVNQGLHAAGGSVSQGASTVGAAVPGGAVISARCAKAPEPEPMATPESTEK
jgi:hypothetical protein